MNITIGLVGVYEFEDVYSYDLGLTPCVILTRTH